MPNAAVNGTEISYADTGGDGPVVVLSHGILMDQSMFAAQVEAPLVIVPLSNKDAYLDRYAEADKGWADRAESRWPAPYWDIDTGMATLLMLLTAVDEGLGACFFGLMPDQLAPFRDAFGIPPAYLPIGATTVGHRAASVPPQSERIAARRRSIGDVIHRGSWDR